MAGISKKKGSTHERRKKLLLLSASNADQLLAASGPDGIPQVLNLCCFLKHGDKFTSTPRLSKYDCPFAVVDLNDLTS
jgi:hypothetical protein